MTWSLTCSYHSDQKELWLIATVLSVPVWHVRCGLCCWALRASLANLAFLLACLHCLFTMVYVLISLCWILCVCCCCSRLERGVLTYFSECVLLVQLCYCCVLCFYATNKMGFFWRAKFSNPTNCENTFSKWQDKSDVAKTTVRNGNASICVSSQHIDHRTIQYVSRVR